MDGPPRSLGGFMPPRAVRRRKGKRKGKKRVKKKGKGIFFPSIG